MGTWQNADGLYVRYGTDQGKRGSRAGVATGANDIRQLILYADLAGVARTIFSADINNDGTLEGFNEGLNTPIPIGSFIVSAHVVKLVTPAGGTSFQVGTWKGDGTAIVDDGIKLAGASVAAVGADGTQIGTQIATDDAYVSVKTIGTYTAGRIKILVNYTIQ